MSAITTQRVIWNGDILKIPFVVGDGTVGDVLALLPGDPEMGLFTTGNVQLAPDALLPGGREKLILRPVYLH